MAAAELEVAAIAAAAAELQKCFQTAIVQSSLKVAERTDSDTKGGLKTMKVR